jgi:Anti-sigma-K factor rskA, C-terminal
VAKTSAAHLVQVDPPVDSDVVDASPAAPVPLPPLVLAPPRKPTWPTLAALAIASGLAAVGLGVWVVLAETRSGGEPAAPSASVEWTLGVLAESDATRYPLTNSVGRIALVATLDGRAVLTLDGLGLAPEGSTYHAWVVPPGSATPLPAGTFDGSERVVPLAVDVARDARVAVTLERGSGSERPSRPLRLTAVRD